MDFLELVKKRQSVRSYLEKPVEQDKIERCLEAARLAPSACNAQPWKFVVVNEPMLKNAVARETFGKIISFNHFSMQAPVLVLIVCEKPNITARIGAAIKNKEFSLIDIGVAAEHFCLAAAEEGLGTCMLGWFDERGVKELLGIHKHKRIVLIITVGYADSSEIQPKKRKELDDIRSYNSYE